MSQAVMGGREAMAERQALGGRTMSQGIFGIVAIILGIVGLAIATVHPAVPRYLDAIAAIAFRLSLIVVGTAFAAAYGRLLARAEGAAIGGQMMGATVGMFVGVAVTILGILALLGVASAVLIPIEVILIGSGLILNRAASVRLASLEVDMAVERAMARRIGEELVFATAGVRAIAGVAVGTLGHPGTRRLCLRAGSHSGGDDRRRGRAVAEQHFAERPDDARRDAALTVSAGSRPVVVSDKVASPR